MIGPEHGAAGDFRKAVAVDVDNVDVAGANGDLVFEDASAFVHEGEDAAIEHLFVIDGRAGDAQLRARFLDDFHHLRVRLAGAAAFLVDVEAPIGLLPEALEFAELIGHARGDRHLLGLEPGELAGPPAKIETYEIVHLEGAHGHTEAADDLVDLVGRSALENHFPSLARVAAEHAVADEARGVAREHGDLAENLPEGHGGGNGGGGGLLAPDHFQKAHHVCRTEEVQADDVFGTGGHGSHGIHVKARGVRRDNGAGLTHLLEFLEDFLFHIEVFVNRFHHHVGLAEVRVGEGGGDQRHALFRGVCADAAPLHHAVVVAADDGHAAVDGFLVHLEHGDGDARVGEAHGDASAHGSAAHDASALDLLHFRVLGDIGDLGHFPLGEEQVNHGFALRMP